MNNLLRQSRIFLNRNASTILTCIGGVGVVVTAVLAAKAAPKANEAIAEAEEEKGEKLTKMEVVNVAGPAYIPAALAGASTLVCIFGANTLNKRQQAALTSAYALLDSSYREYKRKIIDLYGKEADSEVKIEVAKDHYDDADIFVEEGDTRLFYDYYSGRYFESTMDNVRRAENTLNSLLAMRDYAYLNEYYELLGLPPIESGDKLGWTPGGCVDRYWQTWIDFDHETVIVGDDLECCIISMRVEPFLNFQDFE